MRWDWKSTALAAQVFGMISIFLISCGLPGKAPDTQCSTSGNVVINISDSYVQRVCGCQEASNTVFGYGSGGFVCTAKIGTYFTFNFVNATQLHSVSVFQGGAQAALVSYPPSTSVVQALSTGTGLGFNDNVTLVHGVFNITSN